MIRVHGIAYWNRDCLTNDSDFFSTDSMKEIAGHYFFSYVDQDKHAYGFDLRSIHTLIHRARLSGEQASNPYTRNPLPLVVVKKVNVLVRFLQRREYPTEWAPLTPPTPEQQWHMAVVDLFHKIDELNYYSSPDWFINLDIRDQRRFYTELHAIWTHRAGLTIQQKQMIVPNFATRLFRHPPWAMVDQSIDSMRKINMNTIRAMIASAEDRNDRILGAMYVMSTLTIVCADARRAYPWLYESVAGVQADDVADDRRIALGTLLGIGWLNEILALPMPSASRDSDTVPAFSLDSDDA